MAADAKLTVEKSASQTSGVKVGDKVTYTVVVTNNGNVTVTGIALSDTLVDLPDADKAIGDLAAEETKTVTYKYTVTQADVDAGKIENTATATGKDPNNNDITNDSSVTVRTDSSKPGINVTKTADKTSKIKQGDKVTYTITVKNTGNVTLNNVKVADTLVSFSGKTDTINSLSPGGTVTFSYKYTATAANIEAGKIVNNATVTGTAPDGKKATDSASITATTQKKPDGGDDDDDDDDDDNPGGGGNPNGGGGNNPGGNNDGVVPAGNTTPEVIPDEPTPTVEPEVDIVDPQPPLAAGTWALLNLIAAIATALGAIVALFRKKEDENEDEQNDKPKDEDEDDNRGKKMLAAKIVGALTGVAAPITFLLTEDMSQQMAMVDKWTILMAVMLVVQIVAAVFNKKASELEEYEDEDAEEAAN